MNFGIIAAGEGSRLAQEGTQVPKPLVRIQGQPMIERLIRIFERCGARSVNVVVNEQMTEVQEFLRGLKMAPGVELNMKVKSTPSSMHTFHLLSSMLRGKGRFIATTVDTIFREDDFAKYVDAYRQAPGGIDGMMAVTSFVDDEKPLWVATDADSRITAFRDTRAEDTRYVSGGIYGLSESAFPVLDRCMESGVSRMRNFQRALVEAGLDLQAFDMGKIIDVDHAADIATANTFLES